MDDLTNIQKTLFSFADSEYKEFHRKLIPGVSEERIIGVRTPVLRKYAKELYRKNAENFFNDLPHRFYEEDNLHAFMLEQISDYDELVKRIDDFLPYVDNWATCDMMSPKCFAKNTDKLYKDAFRWIDCGHTYHIRFGLCMLMKYYLDENFKIECLEKAAAVKSDEYYVKMAVAWFFATALTYKFSETLPYIKEQKLEPWIHNKTIQKACESYRISKEIKEKLKTYKVK